MEKKSIIDFGNKHIDKKYAKVFCDTVLSGSFLGLFTITHVPDNWKKTLKEFSSLFTIDEVLEECGSVYVKNYKKKYWQK